MKSFTEWWADYGEAFVAKHELPPETITPNFLHFLNNVYNYAQQTGQLFQRKVGYAEGLRTGRTQGAERTLNALQRAKRQNKPESNLFDSNSQ